MITPDLDRGVNRIAPDLAGGVSLIERFCLLNALPAPVVNVHERENWHVNACAYWRPDVINICPVLCSRLGTAGRSWSWPGYTVDRTPYGVVAHELGHRVDWLRTDPGKRGRYWGAVSAELRKATGEPPLTTYCPDDGEWFAEHFRLFITNPDLLARLRPRLYALLRGDALNLTPVVEGTWHEVLTRNDAPDRTIAAARKKVEASPPPQLEL